MKQSSLIGVGNVQTKAGKCWKHYVLLAILLAFVLAPLLLPVALKGREMIGMSTDGPVPIEDHVRLWAEMWRSAMIDF